MDRLLHHWVTEQADRRPDATAVRMAHEEITFGDLDTSSTRWAKALKAAGCARGDRVCLLLPKSPMAIVAILGVLKADCIYVPIDISSPALRVAQLIASCQPACLLAGRAAGALLDELLRRDQRLRSLTVGWMDPGSGPAEFEIGLSYRDTSGYSSTTLPTQNTPRDAAYILFTSGSTGMPKGVVITHASVIHFVAWATKYFGINASDRISGHSPLHFDLSVFDMYGALAAGAQLHLVPPDATASPHKLAEFIRASELTQWFSVPSALAYMAAFGAVEYNDFPALGRVLWCGEVLPTRVLVHWMKRLPHASFTNLYGPTETTIASSYYTVPRCPDDDKAAIPIGAACDGEELLVLDEHLRPVAPGQSGDLYIRGVGLSPGYWRDEETTRAVFLSNPYGGDLADRLYKTGDLATIGANGLFYFLGRADSQIKSRGYRIELGEIEVALQTIASLCESAVVPLPTDGFEGVAICCAYAPAPNAEITPAVLRRALGAVLPSYMLPSRWSCFESLPRNANGKIDRRQLQEHFRSDAAQAS